MILLDRVIHDRLKITTDTDHTAHNNPPTSNRFNFLSQSAHRYQSDPSNI